MIKLTRFFKKSFLLDNTGRSPAFFSRKKNYLANKKIARELIKFSKLNNNINCRVCLHKTKKDEIHNMIVLLNKKNKSYPHQHYKSEEIYHLISGSVKVFIYDKKMKLKDIFTLSKKNIIFKVAKKTTHMVKPITKNAIFHEIKLGSNYQLNY